MQGEAATGDRAADLPENPLLRNALLVLDRELGPLFEHSDQASLRHQVYHRTLTVLAAASGTLAVLLAIIQLSGIVPSPWPTWAEVLAASLAFAAVFVGVSQKRHPRWLLERHRAERCRLARYALLTDPEFLSGEGARTAAWEAKVNGEAEEIRRLDWPKLHLWVEEHEAPQALHQAGKAATDARLVAALAGYYHRARLLPQIEFFRQRSASYGKADDLTKAIPSWLFFASILAVLLHFLAGIFLGADTAGHGIGLLFTIFAASLPVVGGGVRTVRLANEFARSACLYRAKRSVLQRLEAGFHAANDHQALLGLMGESEQFLENEHKEWLRLMVEAEWYG